MSKVTLEQMLEAGLHFGHQTFRWHPGMKPYIFDARDGVHIIDLTKTDEKLEEALGFVAKVAQSGGKLLLVGTKRQASGVIKEIATESGLPYVAQRWPGGLLTNYQTMKKRIEYLKSLREKVAKKDFGDMTKQEIGLLEKKLALLEESFGGLDSLTELPKAVFIVDVVREKYALKEAIKLGIPAIAMADTNANPEGIAYLIPANDDAKQGVKLITKAIVDEYTKNYKPVSGGEDQATQANVEEDVAEVLEQKEVQLAETKQEKEKAEAEKTEKLATTKKTTTKKGAK